MASEHQEIFDRYLQLCRTASQRTLEAAEVEAINAFMDSYPSLDQTLGTRYRSVTPRELALELTVGPGVLQPWGVTNGGVYASLGETAGSMASYIAAGAESPVMGTSNETHFLRPSRVGDVLVSTATPEHLGRTSHLWRIEHRNESTGKLCALTFLKTAVLPEMPRQANSA